MDDESLRHEMVETQIAARGIHDLRVLEAMRAVPRHLFVPEGLRENAYMDRPVSIGEGQTISQPYMVAIMTQALNLSGTERVLEIGTGSGYQTAILARLASQVVTVERHARLAERAGEVLTSLDVKNVQIVVGDGTEGYAEAAPYDRILVTAGAPAVPDALRMQLADGGCLVIPVGPPECQRLTTIARHGEQFTSRRGEACVFVPLVGRAGWPELKR